MLFFKREVILFLFRQSTYWRNMKKIYLEWLTFVFWTLLGRLPVYLCSALQIPIQSPIQVWGEHSWLIKLKVALRSPGRKSRHLFPTAHQLAPLCCIFVRMSPPPPSWWSALGAEWGQLARSCELFTFTFYLTSTLVEPVPFLFVNSVHNRFSLNPVDTIYSIFLTPTLSSSLLYLFIFIL